MQHLERPPHTSLEHLVQAFWWHHETHAANGETQTLMPDSHLEIVFAVGEIWLLEKRLPPVFLVGLRDTPLELHLRGETVLLGARLFAWNATTFLGINQGCKGFQTEVGTALLELSAQVRPLLLENQPEAAFSRLEQWFLERPAAPSHLTAALQRQHKTRDIAAILGLSERQLERVVQQRTGTTPKALSRLMRFERAMLALYRAPQQSLANLALECGYADQAHLTREFSAFAGTTPSVFAKGVGNLQDE